MMKKIMAYFSVFLLFFMIANQVSAKAPSITIEIKTNSASTYTTKNELSHKSFSKLLKNMDDDKIEILPNSDTYITYQKQKFLLDDQIGLVHIQRGERVQLSEPVWGIILKEVNRLKKQHYGSYKSWDEVNKLLPRYSKFEIIDLETGKRFKVQRRAGNYHADVQPLTHDETKTMKEIYNGKWSWRRRAILIPIGKEKIAASMHGMPHGGGALVNGFPGHFCIHFKDSITHRSESMDLSHKLMALKAANKLDGFYSKLDPYELADVFVASLNQKDQQLVRHTVWEEDIQSFRLQEKLINRIELIKIEQMHRSHSFDNEFVREIPVKIQYAVTNKREQKANVTILVSRSSLQEPWKVHLEEFSSQLN
ncbi:hypothetical protein LS684_11125 [Cytobacillus spongiae]|uniref:hypothetical protein n=1 Tax=Cytobacillus spongiae TaxID=2901381 RepID=UPI001F48C1AE|nr:hypothetical protein [Cytobacillus spongiae]UII54245.1 hypothetical protein LS684_11125 [Cytobacillus spongiae]